MPHVDMWAKIQAEAADISREAQTRRPPPRFSIFTSMQLLAPAFIVVLVFGATFISLQSVLPKPAHDNPTSTRLAVTPQPNSRYDISNPVNARLTEFYENRLEGMRPVPRVASAPAVDILYVSDFVVPPQNQPDVRAELRSEWRDYMEQKQRPDPNSNPMRLIRPFHYPQVPQ